MKRIKEIIEPRLKAHNYIVSATTPRKEGMHTKYTYCMTLDEVEAMKKKFSKSRRWVLVQVFRAFHHHVGSWIQV